MSTTTHHAAAPPQGWSLDTKRESRLRLRLRVFFRRHRLDGMLALGVDAGESAELAVRAEQLLNRRYRGHLADSFDEAVCVAEGKGARAAAAPPLAMREVRAARAALLELANALRQETVHGPSGVALAQRLLTDGAGPLYIESQNDALWHAARRATLALTD